MVRLEVCPVDRQELSSFYLVDLDANGLVVALDTVEEYILDSKVGTSFLGRDIDSLHQHESQVCMLIVKEGLIFFRLVEPLVKLKESPECIRGMELDLELNHSPLTFNRYSRFLLVCLQRFSLNELGISLRIRRDDPPIVSRVAVVQSYFLKLLDHISKGHPEHRFALVGCNHADLALGVLGP